MKTHQITQTDIDDRKLNMPFENLMLLHSERPKLYTILAFLSAIGLKTSAAGLNQWRVLGA